MAALATVQDPDLHRDLVTLGMVEGLEVSDGRVSFTLILTTSACPLKDQLESDCRGALGGLPWVKGVEIRTTSKVRKARDPSADRKALDGVANVLAIGSGKG